MSRQSIGFRAIVAVLVLAAGSATAVPDTRTESRLAGTSLLSLPPSRFFSWTADNGLPQSSVYAIVQSREGYLWFATLDGLIRFDGLRFTVFNARNTPGLSGNRFTTLFQDREGALWIGSEEGRIFELRGGSVTEYPLDPPFEGGIAASITAFREGNDGTIWVALRRAVYRIAPGDDTARPSPVADAVRRDPKCKMGMWGSFAFFSPTHLVYFADGEIRSVTSSDGLPDLEGGMVYEDGEGTVWLAPRGSPLRVLDDGRIEPHPSGFVYEPEDDWFALLEDSRKNLWVGVEGTGMVRIAPDGRRTVYGEEHGIRPDLFVQDLFEDREGNVWAGSQLGLFEFKGDLVHSISERDGLGDDNTKAVCEGPDGTIWVVGGQVLNAWRDGAVARYVRTPSDPGRVLTALYVDRDGGLWMGTDEAEDSLLQFEDGRFIPLAEREPIPPMTVRAIVQDREDTFWMATDRGVVHRRGPGDYVVFTTEQGLPDNDARVLLADRAGAVWAGGTGGLTRIEGDRIEAFTESDGLSGNHVRSLYQDRAGVLWIGTYDGGLTRYADGRFVRYTTENGLHNDGVFAILEDDFGNFWMSCNVGIYRVRRQELEDFAAGRVASIWSVPYRREDGMLKSECNGGLQPSAWKSRDGRLWFTSQGGVVVVDPRLLPSNAPPPVPVVEEVVVDGTAVPLGSELRVEPSQESLEIRYTAPTFIKPELARFRYQLEGLDDSWIDTGVRRAVYFTYLPPGDYVFRLAASTSDGRWNETTTSLRVTVLAPFWRTWWAYALYLALLVGLVYGGVRLRVSALSRRSRELEQLVSVRTHELADKAEELAHTVDRLSVSEQKALEANRAKSVFLANMSHELRTPLNAVLGFVQLMERERGRSEEDREGLEVIRRSGEHLLGLINDVLSIAKIEAGRLTLAEEPFKTGALLDSVEQMIRGRAEAKGLELTVERDADLPPVVVGDEGKLRQVLLNLLGNAVKFTERGYVCLRAHWVAGDGESGRLEVEVEDTGTGIDPEEIEMLFEPFAQTESGRNVKEGTGLGLVIAREMVRLMGGDIWVRSEVGRGATFGFEAALRVAPDEKTRRARRVLSLAPGQPAARLLVVDDIHDNRLLLRKLLESVGFEVRQAETGEAAIEEWERWRPDLIWMDMRMPGMDGREATREIRRREGAREERDAAQGSPARGRCTIVALTASAFDHERDEILDAGCDDFVAKPWREEAIFEKLERHLGVEYVYEGEETADGTTPHANGGALSASRFARIGANVGAEFVEAMRIGNNAQALEALEAIRAVDPELADELARAILNFQMSPLFKLIDEVDAIWANPSQQAD